MLLKSQKCVTRDLSKQDKLPVGTTINKPVRPLKPHDLYSQN